MVLTNTDANKDIRFGVTDSVEIGHSLGEVTLRDHNHASDLMFVMTVIAIVKVSSRLWPTGMSLTKLCDTL